MSRTRIPVYVDEEQEAMIEKAADREDMSKSAWMAAAAKEKLDRDMLDSLAHQYDLEQRLLGLVDDAADRAADQVADEIRDVLNDELDIEDQDETETLEWGDS